MVDCSDFGSIRPTDHGAGRICDLASTSTLASNSCRVSCFALLRAIGAAKSALSNEQASRPLKKLLVWDRIVVAVGFEVGWCGVAAVLRLSRRAASAAWQGCSPPSSVRTGRRRG